MPLPEDTRIYRARTLFPVNASPVSDGGLAVRDGEIIGVGRWKDLAAEHPGACREDLGEVILMPGLINAHCHLDYTMMRGALFGGGGFSEWIRRINALRRSLDQADYLGAILKGAAELRRWGCTTVLNIESFPELLPGISGMPLRVWWFLEVMDIRSRLELSDALEAAIRFLEEADGRRGGFGISPHAPYTVSRELYGSASEFARVRGIPLCTHLAESSEEMAMFARGEGPLYDFLRSIGRSMGDCGGITPVQAVVGTGLLPEGSLLVHMNEITEGDRELLRSTAGKYPVIHCPRTHAYFGREPFDLAFYLESGIPVLLGTDSLASNHDLDMFSEMRALQTSFPSLDPELILRMATVMPAAAIGRSGRLGELSPGALADFIAIPDRGGEGNLAERVLANTAPPDVWISGCR
jgi:cytosine/adenosine deaminase-related metal-dependent hydrolase